MADKLDKPDFGEAIDKAISELKGESSQSDELIKQSLEHLFSEDEMKMLMVNDFSKSDLNWITLMYAIHDLLIIPAFENPLGVAKQENLGERLSMFRKHHLAARLSKDRLSRKEIFEALSHSVEKSMMEKIGGMRNIFSRI